MHKTIIFPIPAFTDNYIWCLHNGNEAYVVDPGDAKPVLQYLQANRLTLKGVLITHHHADHIAGLPGLLAQFPALMVTGPVSNRIPQLTKMLTEGERIELPELQEEFVVLEVPAHTSEHIAYLGDLGLFCGDTLFSAGCGRLFEGTPEQMQRNFRRFKKLSPATKIYCTHEYTLANLKFALAITPNNSDLLAYQTWVKQQRQQDKPSLPTTLATELLVNPYMREEDPEVVQGVSEHYQQEFSSSLEVFTAIRRWKDIY